MAIKIPTIPKAKAKTKKTSLKAIVLKNLIGGVIPSKLGRPRKVATINKGKESRAISDVVLSIKNAKKRFNWSSLTKR